MVKKYLIWPIRFFLYLLAIFISNFYIFCLFISTDYGSKFITNYLFEDNIKYQDISIEPSLLGMQVDIGNFQYTGAADFSGEEIKLKINFLNSVVGKKIYVSMFSLKNAEVKLNEAEQSDQIDQTEVFIDQLSINNLKVGNTVFQELSLSNFLTFRDSFGFNFQNLNLELPGNLNAIKGLDGKGYFYDGKLFADLNTKEGALYFSFFETPQILENLTGEIYLDFNNKFKIPYSNFSAQDNEKDLKLTFKYEEEFQLQMSSRGSEKTFLSYLPKSQRYVKKFFQESNFKAKQLDILFSISSFNEKLNFSSVLVSDENRIDIGGAEFKVNSLKTYIDNTSINLFGDEFHVSDYSFGNLYLVNNFIFENKYELLLDDRRISLKFDNEGEFESIYGDFSFTENQDIKLNLNDKNLLLNYKDIFIEFNFLDSYKFQNNILTIFPKNFKSNFFGFDENELNSFDFDFENFALKNINSQFSIKSQDENPLRNSSLSFSKLNFGFKNSYINIGNENLDFGGLIDISGENISYSDTTFTIDALRVLSLIDIRSRLLNILNADFKKLNQNNFFINTLDGKIFVDSSGYANINQLNMNFDVGNAELSGTISSNKDSFDDFNLEMIFNSTVSESIPWYVAILGGLPAAASAVVVTEVLEEGLSDVTSSKYSISGNVDNLNIQVKQ